MQHLPGAVVPSQILISLINTGRTPARNVKTVVVTFMSGTTRPISDLAQWMKRVIDAQNKGRLDGIHEVIGDDAPKALLSHLDHLDNTWLYAPDLMPPTGEQKAWEPIIHAKSQGVVAPEIPVQFGDPTFAYTNQIWIVFGEITYVEMCLLKTFTPPPSVSTQPMRLAISSKRVRYLTI